MLFRSKDQNSNMVSVAAIISDVLRDIIQKKACEAGVKFNYMAGHYMLLGIEAERKEGSDKK